MVRVEILELVIKAKKAFADNNLDEAYYAWCEIYDKLEGVNYMFELHKAMELFSNDEVYGITDYGKKLNGYA